MERRHTPYSAVAGVQATSSGAGMAARCVQRVEAYQGDTEATERKAAGQCRACWYFRRPRVGGAAMTRWYCGICAGPQIAGSTAVGTVCKGCGDKHSLCVECGGDLEGRERRRKWPEGKATAEERGW